MLSARRMSSNVCVSRPRPVIRRILPAPPKASVDPVEVSYFVGKSIILFTMFYCGLNWAHYREIRKQLEKDDDKK